MERRRESSSCPVSSLLSRALHLTYIKPDRNKLAELKKWLEEDEKRRLVILHEDPDELKNCLSLFVERAKGYAIETPVVVEGTAKKIGWESVLMTSAVLGAETIFWEGVKKKIEEVQMAAHLLLCDSADFGIFPFLQRKNRGLKKIRNGLFLEGKAKDVPAIIVGAGPSLQKCKEALALFKDKALIFAGGSAMSALDFQAHFGGMIDGTAPYDVAKRYPFAETPIFFQSRVNSANFSLIHGEAVWFPDSHHSFLNWIDGVEDDFDAGWTVGTFLTKIAYLMGCNPIILVGMDLAYENGSKYGHMENGAPYELVSYQSGEKEFLTQRDWLFARDWLENISKDTERVWIDAREGGLPLGSNFKKMTLDQVILYRNNQEDLAKKAFEMVRLLPYLEKDRHGLWKMSLEKCFDWTHLTNPMEEEECDEIAYQKLLLPLWQKFRPLIEREMGKDDHIGIHRLLFFQRVIQEHLNV